jgi:hypothetical protein
LYSEESEVVKIPTPLPLLRLLPRPLPAIACLLSPEASLLLPSESAALLLTEPSRLLPAESALLPAISLPLASKPALLLPTESTLLWTSISLPLPAKSALLLLPAKTSLLCLPAKSALLLLPAKPALLRAAKPSALLLRAAESLLGAERDLWPDDLPGRCLPHHRRIRPLRDLRRGRAHQIDEAAQIVPRLLLLLDLPETRPEIEIEQIVDRPRLLLLLGRGTASARER